MRQKDKTKFRDSARWKKFRLFIKALHNNTDPITDKPLHKGWNCHHLDLNSEHYQDISNPDNFIPLNKQTHEFIHWLYRYYSKDKAVIHRLVKVLEKMMTISSEFCHE